MMGLRAGCCESEERGVCKRSPSLLCLPPPQCCTSTPTICYETCLTSVTIGLLVKNRYQVQVQFFFKCIHFMLTIIPRLFSETMSVFNLYHFSSSIRSRKNVTHLLALAYVSPTRNVETPDCHKILKKWPFGLVAHLETKKMLAYLFCTKSLFKG